jgi:hypothetical protein
MSAKLFPSLPTRGKQGLYEESNPVAHENVHMIFLPIGTQAPPLCDSFNFTVDDFNIIGSQSLEVVHSGHPYSEKRARSSN